MKKVLFIAANSRSLIANRGDLIQSLKLEGYEVVALLPQVDFLQEVKTLEIDYQTFSLARTGINPIKDISVVQDLVRRIKEINPDIVYSYGIKPVIYGSLAAKLAGVRSIFSMITGLGYLFTGESLKQKILRRVARILYRLAFRFNKAVFFQNPDDLALFRSLSLIDEKTKALITNGSGVNLKKYTYEPLPDMPTPSFLLIARLLKDKGVVEYIQAIKIVKIKYPETTFSLLGGYDPDLPHSIDKSVYDEIANDIAINYIEFQKDVKPFIRSHSVIVLPSYREGTPRSILEGMAIGRAIITTDVPGCKETVKNNYNGLLVRVKDPESLALAMISLIEDPIKVKAMGDNSRRYVEDKYDVNIVNKIILDEFKL